MKTCPKCNGTNDIDAEFCVSCGLAIVLSSSAEQTTEQQSIFGAVVKGRSEIDSKLVARIRKNFENDSDEELFRKYEENNNEEYSAEACEAIKQILMERGIALPSQKELIKKVEVDRSADSAETASATESLKPIAVEEIQKSVNSAISILLIWGIINIIAWFFWGADDRSKLLSRFSDIKPLLWILIYGGLLIGISQVLFGGIGLIFRHPFFVLINGYFLLLIGSMNAAGEFLAIPALKEYGYILSMSDVIKNLNYMWVGVGVMQIFWGLGSLGNYSRIVHPRDTKWIFYPFLFLLFLLWKAISN